MSFADALRRLRNSAGYSQDELAQLVGVDRSAVTQWENNFHLPRMANTQKLAAIFGVPVSALVDDEGDFASRGASVKLTTLGKVHAGPFTDEGDEAQTVEVPASLLASHPDAMAVIVEGDCMSRVAPEGIAAVIDPNLEPTNGKIVIVETEDHQALIRRWYRGGNTLMLVADSYGDYPDIVVSSDEPIRVVGTVVWLQSPSELGE